MADQTIDVLMRIVGPNGPMPAESLTVFTGALLTDVLRDRFVPGEFCELREFSFSAGIEGSLSKFQADKTKKAAKAVEKAPELLTLAEKRAHLHQSQINRAEKRGAKEFVDMQPVDFTRIMDSASTLLFNAMTGCDTLPEISIVKRKAAGASNAGSCYLRLDFQKVLITRLEWKDSEHLMVESGTFIYRSVTIRYRPQEADGRLGTVVRSIWTMSTPGSTK